MVPNANLHIWPGSQCTITIIPRVLLRCLYLLLPNALLRIKLGLPMESYISPLASNAKLQFCLGCNCEVAFSPWLPISNCTLLLVTMTKLYFSCWFSMRCYIFPLLSNVKLYFSMEYKCRCAPHGHLPLGFPMQSYSFPFVPDAELHFLGPPMHSYMFSLVSSVKLHFDFGCKFDVLLFRWFLMHSYF